LPVTMKNTKKNFLKKPEYPGGKEALKAYVKSNLVYPQEAKKKHIEGVVQLLAQIDDNGNVGEVTVENGIGGGCDEEAVRLIKNVQFGSVKNRGVRLKTRKRFRIEFKLPPQKKKVSYSVTPAQKTPSSDKQPQSGKTYSYTIRMNSE
jgi:TonB family protein